MKISIQIVLWMDAKFVAKLDWFLTTVFSNSSNLIFVIRIVNSFWIDDSMLWYDMIWLIGVIVGHHLKPNCNYSYGQKIVIADDWKSLCSQADKFPLHSNPLTMYMTCCFSVITYT